jgi:hypothetical protein
MVISNHALPLKKILADSAFGLLVRGTYPESPIVIQITNYMKPKKIKNVKGMLCRSVDGRAFFRVYKPDGSFCDYHIVHCDLEIEVIDDDAYAYCKDGKWYIDYGAATLGISEGNADAKS